MSDESEQATSPLASLLDGVELVTGGLTTKEGSSFVVSFENPSLNNNTLLNSTSTHDDNNLLNSTGAHDNNNIARLERVPNFPNVEDGLESIDAEALRKYVEPIWNSLANIDAEELLTLKRVDVGTGARLFEGVDVLPIYDEITPPENEYISKNKNESCVRYLHITEKDRNYSIGIFVFHPYARMPLHDHPEMCVLSRVLYGDLTRRSLDLDDDNNNQPQSSSSWLSNIFSNKNRNTAKIPENAKRAYKRELEYLRAPEVTMLFPYKGNLHEFVAGPNGAAVLDVLIPPYGDSRDCTFYTVQDDDSRSSSSHGGGACWLIPSEQPDNFHCLSGEYHHLALWEEDNDMME